MYKIYKWLFIILLSVVILTSVALGAFYIGQKSTNKTTTFTPTLTQQVKTEKQSVTQEAQGSLFIGKVKKITSDLGLFNILENDKENNISENIVYYEAGTYTRGEFKDYMRVLAIRPSEGPGQSLQYVLVTKDFKTYLLDDPQNKTVNYPESDWENPYRYIDKNKIAKIVTLDTEHPKTISLEKSYGLIKENNVLIENQKNGRKDKNGYDIYIDVPITQFDQSRVLTSSQKQLTLYAGSTNWGNGDGSSSDEKKLISIRKQYLNTTTLIHVSDSTGLTYSYILSSQQDIDTYLNKLPEYEKALITYKKQIILYDEKKLAEYPTYPEYLTLPGIKLTKQSAQLPSNYFDTYDVAFPGACGGSQSTFIVDSLKDNDLESLTSSSVFPLYILKDTKHPLYELAYQVKTGVDNEAFKGVNNGKTKPTFDEYITKHPLLFFKDAWGRWGVMGEFDIKLIGGCGKPVIYLYPKKQTTIHLSFTTPMLLSAQIPAYYGGWLVSAKPDSTLIDLQPQYTDCSAINYLKFGSEYADNACKTHTYPYIYWSGKSVQKPYPKVEKGWIVTKESLESFMKNKLKEIGLTQKESNDMTSYWLPKMKEKNTPYYRISFFQTKDMNDFIPMQVSPQPDSVLRVFLDYQALSTKPKEEPYPQQFQKFDRSGFTLVEWGGLQ